MGPRELPPVLTGSPLTSASVYVGVQQATAREIHHLERMPPAAHATWDLETEPYTFNALTQWTHGFLETEASQLCMFLRGLEAEQAKMSQQESAVRAFLEKIGHPVTEHVSRIIHEKLEKNAGLHELRTCVQEHMIRADRPLIGGHEETAKLDPFEQRECEHLLVPNIAALVRWHFEDTGIPPSHRHGAIFGGEWTVPTRLLGEGLIGGATCISGDQMVCKGLESRKPRSTSFRVCDTRSFPLHRNRDILPSSSNIVYCGQALSSLEQDRYRDAIAWACDVPSQSERLVILVEEAPTVHVPSLPHLRNFLGEASGRSRTEEELNRKGIPCSVLEPILSIRAHTESGFRNMRALLEALLPSRLLRNRERMDAYMRVLEDSDGTLSHAIRIIAVFPGKQRQPVPLPKPGTPQKAAPPPAASPASVVTLTSDVSPPRKPRESMDAHPPVSYRERTCGEILRIRGEVHEQSQGGSDPLALEEALRQRGISVSQWQDWAADWSAIEHRAAEDDTTPYHIPAHHMPPPSAFPGRTARGQRAGKRGGRRRQKRRHCPPQYSRERESHR